VATVVPSRRNLRRFSRRLLAATGSFVEFALHAAVEFATV
jgi:hypothetical protein